MITKTKYFAACVATCLLLCGAQIMGNTLLILACLSLFFVTVGWACVQNFTLPILLFFLPWSQLLRTSPTTFSFYTFALVLVCAISIFKNWKLFRKYHIVTGLGLMLLTLLTKLIDGSDLSFDYIAFMMMLLLFPVVKEEWSAKGYSYFNVTVFFTAGVALAAICAQIFASAPNISAYINVHSYLTIKRMCGFYGDPNFYTAQITAALASCLILLLKERENKNILLSAVFVLLLIYCGLMSGSKSFAIVTALLLLLWIFEVVKLRGRPGFKALLLTGSIVAVLGLAASTVIDSLIEVIATRFSYADDVSGFTTGRTDLWMNYARELASDWKLLLLGKGYTNVILDGRASHNTPLQSIYQFGLLGVPMLIFWVAGFYQSGWVPRGSAKRETIYWLMFMAGTFLPWLAIDALFFDEFFLLQWFAFIGLRQLYIPKTEVIRND